jgi:hypothetical protein
VSRFFKFYGQPCSYRPGAGFFFTSCFSLCWLWLKLRMHEIFRSQSMGPPTRKTTYISKFKVTLLHILWSYILHVFNHVSKFPRSPQCHGNAPLCIEIGTWATVGLAVITQYGFITERVFSKVVVGSLRTWVRNMRYRPMKRIYMYVFYSFVFIYRRLHHYYDPRYFSEETA